MSKKTKTWWRDIEWIEVTNWQWGGTGKTTWKLSFMWRVANYYDIEDGLYDEFIEDLKQKDMYELYRWFRSKEKENWYQWWINKNRYLILDLFAKRGKKVI